MNISSGRKLLRTVLGLGLLVGLTSSTAQAGLQIQKYVGVTVSVSEFDMGELTGSADYVVPNALTVHVSANCIHAGLTLTASALEEPSGAKIEPSRILVKRQGAVQYVPLGSPVNLTGVMAPGIVDVILNFRVQSPGMDCPGTYTGTFILTSAPLP